MKQFFRGSDADFYSQLEKVTTSVLPVKSVHEKWDIQLKPGITYETLGSNLLAFISCGFFSSEWQGASVCWKSART